MAALVTALAVVPSIVILSAPAATAAAFSPGDIVVARVGTGDAALTNAATPVFLDEFTPDGTLVRTVALPTAGSGANRRVTTSGSATSEGGLSLSQDGRYLTLGGYDADPGTASIASSTTAAVNRVVARVDVDGAVDSSTAITDAFSGNNIRGVASADGGRHWAVGANGGVRLAEHGATTTTQINTVAPTNIRTATAAGGQLFVSTGSGTTGVYTVGTGLPTTPGHTPALVAAVPSPYAVVALDRDPGVSGVDTLYVADDSAAPNGGILKFSFDGVTWTARGAYRPNSSGVRGLTGTVTGSSVSLFATTSATLGSLVRVEDTAAFAEPIAATGAVLRTASANTAFRGVAFAPSSSVTAPSIVGEPQDAAVASGASATLTVSATGTGPLAYQWYTGTAGDTANPIADATSASYTTPALTAPASYWVRVTGPGGQADSRTATVTITGGTNSAPTIGPVPVAELALTVGDPDNPPALRTVDIADAETPASGLTITVDSSNPAVASGGSTGSGSPRTLTVDPVGVGHATLTVTVSDGALTSATTFAVAVSAARPAGTHNHYGHSDASTAIDLGGGAMVVADDETNVLRVYDRDHSRYPAQSFDVRAAGLALRDADVTREIDIEASARQGDTIYWVGSHGQNSSAKTRLNRQELFSTTVSGTGTGASLSLGGSYQLLRNDLIAWDQANGDALGIAAAATRAPEGDGLGGPTGVNIEAAEFAADGSLLLGFRGPLTSDNKAIVIPVTNIAALVAANPTTGVSASFGTALRWDLGGRGVREIRKNTAGEYLIIAGPTSAGTGAAGEFKFYSWDGDAAHQPLPRAGSLDTVAATGKPEAIVEVPSPLTDTSSVQVLADSGDTVFYGDGIIAKDLPPAQRKSISAVVAVGAGPVCTSGVSTVGSVQGTGDASPKVGQTVTVRGTVVSDSEGAQPALRGFYLQDGGDGDGATSDGLFVFDNGANLVSLGDVVQVTGLVSEFQGQTQLAANAAGVQSCNRQGAVTPTDLILPRATAGDLESYEGMLVRFHQTLTVTEHFQLGRFGQVVVSAGGKLQQPTSVIRATDTAAVSAKQNANNLNRLIVDDATNGQNPDPIVFGRAGQPLSAANTLRGGDTLTDAVGVLTYTWAGNAASGNAYRLRPLNALGGTAVFDAANERPTTRPGTGAGAVKVTGANLLNFFNTYTGCKFGTLGGPADCRGANNDTEYQRQLAKEVASLRFLDADVTGVMEIENDGYGPTSAIQALVDALNAADGPGSWGFVDADAATGVTDVAGTDAIKTALLYRADRVMPVAGATFVDQNPVFERRPVAQTFQTPAGARLTVVANHFKSKGSCPTSGPDADQRDGQSCWNARRTQQATELADWLDSVVKPGAGDDDVLIVGDLNSYAGEDPIAVLEATGYTNLAKAFHGPETYSYVFDGQWGYLDYALSSPSLTAQVTGAGEAHINADEPSVLDYNTDFKSAGQVASLYAPDRFRTSDHDPVLVGIDLGAPPVISGSPVAGTVGLPYSFGFTLSGPASVTLASGSLPAGVFLNEDGTLTGTPTSAGTSAFTVRATSAFGVSEAAVSLTVAPGVSTVDLVAGPSPVATGGQVTLTATVSAAVAVSGTVTFREGSMVLGSAEVAGGTASLVVSAPASGHRSVTAEFSGNADVAGSVSAAASFDVVDPVTLGGTLPGGTVGAAYSAAVEHTGGAPVTLSVSAGTLPAGLTLTGATLAGTPTAAGTFTFTVKAENAVSSATRDYTVAIGAAATTTVVTSSANPAITGTTVRFTATVSGPLVPTGTVQFSVDGNAIGSPVALVNGTAVSQPVVAVTLGGHQVTAVYSGSASFTASTGTLNQVVHVGIKILSPTAGGSYSAGANVPIRFQLTSASGQPLPALASALLLASGRLTVAGSGAQSFPATRPSFDPYTNTFTLVWNTARRPAGQVTATVSVTYPDAPTQSVPVRFTLR
ncbi:Alkaline phosphatase [Alloactinosynnema sp. L-07]|uniref:ExeM/NucH family extracellular endonuclease n=1 Tax=Alloactinosynnema sp. L-07 TaxID=1653480 RepID=UPI00065F0819|nr:ExeM/NucH family extracellular endonuclease [Alloactinosynnema sp. L-07]CRK55993.1 Alkaline phosphatase [Alloactinosynnema sp. L-07]